MGGDHTLILYDFKCKCGHVFEKMARLYNRTYICERCGELADRVISTPRIKLEGWSEHFPSAALKWTKMHEEEAKKTTE